MNNDKLTTKPINHEERIIKVGNDEMEYVPGFGFVMR